MIKLMFKKFYSHKLERLNQLICAAAMFATIVCSMPTQAEDLSSIQREIQLNTESKLQKQKQQKQLEQELSLSEQEIAKSSLQVSITKKKITEQRTELIALQKKTEELKEDKRKQQLLLQQQLTSAYMTGQNDLVKLILNQEDLSKIVRAKGYYHYLNQARLDSIENLQKTQIKLEQNAKQQADTLTSLRLMYEEQKKIEANVRSQKNKRDQALRKLNQDITYQTTKLAELATLEQNLKARIKKAAEEREQAIAKEKARQLAIAQEQEKTATAAINNAKFSTLKGDLQWPIKGNVVHRFGSTRSSQVTWKGITITANEGEQVRAVASGRVLYAGYFKGYGMVIALDHNDSYITLYGYNETLLQKAGAIVQQGESIALAGKSGGQETSTLYFELNYKGKAQDPLSWLSKKK
jgi:septal ring factor EnvC (AmiA/AmiB activator)